jgi:hypothetical protein
MAILCLIIGFLYAMIGYPVHGDIVMATIYGVMCINTLSFCINGDMPEMTIADTMILCAQCLLMVKSLAIIPLWWITGMLLLTVAGYIVKHKWHSVVHISIVLVIVFASIYKLI